nr:Down syndrome cell adhesion molecule-like protein Dscam2 [Maniola hyperantus]
MEVVSRVVSDVCGVVAASSSGSAPRLAAADSEVSVRAGTALCLPCVASDYPPPQYTYVLQLRASSSGSAPRLAAADSEVSVRAGTALCLPCVASDYPPPQYTYVLQLRASSSGSAPRLAAADSEVSVRAGTALCLPCVASDYPPPQYTWYREREGRLAPVAAGGALWLWAGGAALCVARAAREHSGAWLCKAYNVFGDATAQVRLDVLEPFAVTVTPPHVVAEVGGTVRLNCSCSEPRAALSWWRDGAALAGAVGPALLLRGVTRAHAGLYQCIARHGARTEQAAAEVRLGDSPPELQYTFIEQALRGGGSVALRCVAAASPPPRVSWLLDGHPLDHYLPHHRYSISEEASTQGEVVSTLNVTATAAGDGGRYSCRASNALGAVEHSARLNIYGPPLVRPMSAVRAVAGENLTLHCPYAGYPIRSIEVHLIGSFLYVTIHASLFYKQLFFRFCMTYDIVVK